MMQNCYNGHLQQKKWKICNMDFKEIIQRANFKNLEIEYNDKNIVEFGLDETAMKLLYENDDTVAVLYTDHGEWINIVNKTTFNNNIIEV